MGALTNPGQVSTLPAMSQSLEFRIGLVLRPDPAAPVSRGIGQSEISEAARLLPAFESALAPATSATVREWLKPLLLSVANAPSQEDFGKRAAAIAMACGDFPAGVWNSGTARAAMKAFKFFPSAAEVCGLLQPHADEILGRTTALRRIAATQPPAPREEWQPPTPEEVERVRETLARHREELAAQRREDLGDEPVPPRYANDIQLLFCALRQSEGKGQNAAIGSFLVQARRKSLGIPPEIATRDWLKQQGMRV